MPHSRFSRDGAAGNIGFGSDNTIELGEMFHKTDVPWIVWSVAKFNMNTQPMHVELTKRGDPLTRITVSVDALTSHRFFRRVAAEAP